MVGWGQTLLHEIFGQPARWREIANFQPILTPSEKSSFDTSRKSTTRFRRSPRTSYVVSKTPKGGSKMQCVQNLNN